MKYSDADAYIDPETGVLKNKLGLTTDTSLEEAEASVAFESSPVFMTKLIKDNLVDLDRE